MVESFAVLKLNVAPCRAMTTRTPPLATTRETNSASINFFTDQRLARESQNHKRRCVRTSTRLIIDNGVPVWISCFVSRRETRTSQIGQSHCFVSLYLPACLCVCLSTLLVSVCFSVIFPLSLSLSLSSFSLFFSLFLIPDDFSLFICICKTEYTIKKYRKQSRSRLDCVQNSRSRCAQPYRLNTNFTDCVRPYRCVHTLRLRRTISPPLRAKEKHERGRSLRFLSFSRCSSLDPLDCTDIFTTNRRPLFLPP
ncbi:hypothetical protein K0M31_004198 [Melipona bicolor]|uniref:Transmembrane protein n=1 Tax=Melipona bicolor TaxID=60889 RepID=A0AA40FWX6_9HYME|nr:hypothetical protein K0M31_004198 [Melipona bicolor]